MSTTVPDKPSVEPVLAAKKAVAGIYGCSTRQVDRLEISGEIPPRVVIGGLIRWRLRTGDPMTGILDHIEAGCPRIEPRD